ncbi:MAG: VOC family protein [Cyclobacteriaceae bacterium]
MQQEFPTEDMALTHILVVSDIDKAKMFYRDVMGAEIFREYGGSSCVLQFLNNWFLLVTGGGPSDDKPTVHFRPTSDADNVAHAFTIRVKDCMASYEALKARGAEFLTPPVDWGAEIRGFFRDPDGNLFEISQA